MKRVPRMVTACIVSAILVLSIATAGCVKLAPSEATETTPTPTVDDSALITPGTLTVGLDYSYAPYAGESSGKVVGIDADVAAALADAMGLKVKFVDISADGGPNALTSKVCDIFLNYDKSTSQKETADYLGTYIYDAPSLFAISKDGSMPAVATDMSSKKIAVQKDSVSAVTVASRYGTNVLDSQGSLVDAFGQLESGSADYVAASGVVGKYIATSYDDIVWVGAIVTPSEIGIGGTASNTVLSAAVKTALSDISSDGILTLIISKWIGSPLASDTKPLTTANAATTAATGTPVTTDVASTSGSGGSSSGSSAGTSDSSGTANGNA